ncbi:MAG: hypothetical protein L0Y72_19890 [Gemmataceae bacterium]|nr:hypothetical protein [Gemmataceae bacterium]MCI0741298.1 hypothetical protein [Gemmataceae bacterium]
MAVDKEMRAFRNALPKLLRNKKNIGRFALVSKDGVVGVWKTMEEALKQGYEHFGLGSFIVQEVVKNEIPKYCSRNVVTCR